jgi:ATP-dependent DNA helicase RecG
MNNEELQTIIQEGEGYKIEFKSNFNSDVSKEMVAFANSSGGRIFIGIDDDGTVSGVDASNSLLSKIRELADRIDPSIDIEIEPFENVLIVYVKEGSNKPYRNKNGFYIRSGANSQKLETRQIIEFIQNEGRIHFDEIIRDDVDFERYFSQTALDTYLKMAGISKLIDDSDILENLGVLEIRNNKPVLNNAGILFFTKNPTLGILQSNITCMLFKGTEKLHILDRKELQGDLIQNIGDAIMFLEKHLNLSYKIEGYTREEILEIPQTALREAVVNAVCHRDYFEKGANVTIEIFDDRVEIYNPGGLPKSLKPEEFGKRSVNRNPIIATLLSRTEYFEKAGTGITRMRNALKEAELPEPVFEFSSFFTVKFIRVVGTTSKTTLKTTSKTTLKILDVLKENPKLSYPQIAEKVGDITREGVKYHIEKLKDANKIKRIGSTKGGYWEILGDY